MTTKANRIQRYYDTHELEGAELTESLLHREIILYVVLVLRWIFNGKKVGVTGNVNFYQTDNPKEPPKSPDIAVVEGLDTNFANLEDIPSYYVGETGPAPVVVFEVASRETWRQDLEEKPAKYAAMGVNEYFVFDPNTHALWTGQWRNHNRLIGWRKSVGSGEYELLEKDVDGRLWSEELQSWLVIAQNELQLYTADGQLRLTKDEADSRRADAAEQRAEISERRAQAEARRAEREARLKEVEARRAELARQQAEAAQQQAEAERQETLKMKELLKKLGYNPDDLK